MKRAYLFIIFVTSAFLPYLSANADIIGLKNGRFLECEIAGKDGNVVVLKTKIGTTKIAREDILSIEKKELPADYFIKEETPKSGQNPAAVLTGSPSADEGVPLRAEGYGETNVQKYKLTVTAEIRSLYNGDAILVKYRTNLPDKTVLFITVKTLGRVLAGRKQTVEGPDFATRFGPFGSKKFASGMYEVEVSCIPSRQENAEVAKKLAPAGTITATAVVKWGSAENAAQEKEDRRKELISQTGKFKELYSNLNIELVSQRKNFDKNKWDSYSASLEKSLDGISKKNAEYRKKTMALDFPVQENAMWEIADTLEKITQRYTEMLYKDNGIEYKRPVSIDSREAPSLKQSLDLLFLKLDDFITAANAKEEKK